LSVPRCRFFMGSPLSLPVVFSDVNKLIRRMVLSVLTLFSSFFLLSWQHLYHSGNGLCCSRLLLFYTPPSPPTSGLPPFSFFPFFAHDFASPDISGQSPIPLYFACSGRFLSPSRVLTALISSIHSSLCLLWCPLLMFFLVVFVHISPVFFFLLCFLSLAVCFVLPPGLLFLTLALNHYLVCGPTFCHVCFY